MRPQIEIKLSRVFSLLHLNVFSVLGERTDTLLVRIHDLELVTFSENGVFKRREFQLPDISLPF